MNEHLNMGHTELVSTNTDDLSRVVRKALQQVETILDMDPLDIDPEDRLKLLTIKKDAANSIINSGLKADENRFRRENKDIIEKLFEKIKNETKTIEHRKK